ncbi:hypothetical protein DFH09DRAFT_1074369 [Mycena vulgaris]|nr:hypothetical protein DFH09DRAFT_1074369 [Mycena vulgaris]
MKRPIGVQSSMGDGYFPPAWEPIVEAKRVMLSHDFLAPSNKGPTSSMRTQTLLRHEHGHGDPGEEKVMIAYQVRVKKTVNADLGQGAKAWSTSLLLQATRMHQLTCDDGRRYVLKQFFRLSEDTENLIPGQLPFTVEEHKAQIQAEASTYRYGIKEILLGSMGLTWLIELKRNSRARRAEGWHNFVRSNDPHDQRQLNARAKGIETFFRDHICGDICLRLRLDKTAPLILNEEPVANQQPASPPTEEDPLDKHDDTRDSEDPPTDG